MSTHTFPCPFCGRRMGVGTELLGKAVRCPHCKQTVHAPTAGGTAANVSPPPPPAPALVAPPEPPAPVFKRPPRETAESILSEPDESEDEVFRSQPGHR